MHTWNMSWLSLRLPGFALSYALRIEVRDGTVRTFLAGSIVLLEGVAVALVQLPDAT